MDASLLSIQFDRSGQNLTVYLGGELDQESATDVDDLISEHIHDGDAVIWLDLAAVSFCDSAGVALFLRLDQRVKGLGARFTLYDPPSNVLRTLELCGADQVLQVRGSRGERRRSASLTERAHNAG